MRYEHDLADTPTTLYAGLGHAERFPDYWELFSPNTGAAGSVNAFDGVKPEKTTQLDFGAQYKTADLEAWASGYVGQVRDFILFDYRTGMMGTTSQARNVDARIMGGELGAGVQADPKLESRRHPRLRLGKNSSDGKALPQMPPLDARLGLTYSEDDWSAGALWRVVAAQNRIDQNKGNVVGKDYDKSGGFGVFSLNGGVPHQQKLQGQHRRRQPVRQSLRRALEPGRQRRVRLPGQRSAGHQGAGAHALDQGRHELLKASRASPPTLGMHANCGSGLAPMAA